MPETGRRLRAARSRARVPLLGAILLLAPPSAAAVPEEGDWQIVIVTPDAAESRLAAAREAIAFWNGTLSELDLQPRLSEERVLVAPPITRRLETYTRQIWLLAGRPVPKGGGPPPPRELLELDGDIVVFFSKQVIFSFAWPFADRNRYFIGIQTDREVPLSYPNVARNVIAHEIGHALGLVHNGNTSTLMCGPCQHLVYRSERPVFFPLTAEERERLRMLHRRQ